MRQPLIVSTRGQITLPITVLPVEMYSPKQVAEWDQQDQLSDAKRKAVLNLLPKRAPKGAKKRSEWVGFSTQTHCSPLRTPPRA